VFLLVHPTLSPPPEHVLPATQTARPVPELRLINVQVAHPTDPYFPTAAAYRHAPRRNSLTPRAEVVSRAIAAVRVVPTRDQVTALHAQARPQFSVAALAWQPTATRTARRRLPPPALSPASACAFRISSRSQGQPFLLSRGSTRQPRSIPVDVWRGGRSCS
jgi:hypothetical protein